MVRVSSSSPVGGAGDRIRIGSVLEARHPATVGVEPHLPEARVAGEDRRVAAGIGESVERLSHTSRPVLVVAHREVQAMALEHLLNTAHQEQVTFDNTTVTDWEVARYFERG